MGNPFGRSTIVPLTNKSGGSVAAGDFVYIDTSNNDAFTTGTTVAYTKGIGIAQQTIASNAIGLVLIDGYAALVNVNASVTRGNFLKSYSVAKQGTDAGSSRASGTCGMFLIGGTTPDAIIWQPDLGGGSGMSDPMTTRGDIIVRDSSNTTARLAIGATAGMVLGKTGSDAAYFLPPGYEFDYAQITSDVTGINATTEATANTIVTGNAVTYDGSTTVIIQFFGTVDPATTSDAGMNLWLYDGSSSIGLLGSINNPAPSGTAVQRVPVTVQRRLTPSNAAHTYGIRGSVNTGSGNVRAGAGGNAARMPAFIRITKV